MKTASAVASSEPLVVKNLTKQFGKRAALRDVSLELPQGRIIGLLGRNGAGKTTLLDLACGLLLPTSGEIRTLQRSAGELEDMELARLGVVRQDDRFVEWKTVGQQLDFNASFYSSWDEELERRLLKELELDAGRKIAQLSPGDRQKLAIMLGVCHRPALLLLDEPMSALDPIIRARFLEMLIERLREDGCTVVVSSHQLADVEKVIDWVVCLDAGELCVSAPLDELQESYAEWTVTAPSGGLPAAFPEKYVLSREGNDRQARVRVCAENCGALVDAFAASHRAEVKSRHLSLDELFPLLLKRRVKGAA
ncbi:MAG: ABC transporter ATP-binding protein [Nibricoccus sp.]